MYTNPKENRPRSNEILFEQFRRKGYRCEEIREREVTIFIIKYEKKNTDSHLHLTNEA